MDNYRVQRTTLWPYLAIDRDSGDSQILLGMTALSELKLLVDCETSQWQYKLDKASIWINTFQCFQKHAKGARVYALIEVNHLITSGTLLLASELLESL
jgi:hypothetical protein